MKTRVLHKILIVASLLAMGLVSSVHFFATKTEVYMSGTIAISPDLEDFSTGISTLFITLFDASSASPMPWGAQRVALNKDKKSGKFYEFILTEDNLRRMGAAGGSDTPPSRFRIKARLDLNGQGGMDQPGDMTGEVRDVAYGSQDIHVLIHKRIQSELHSAHP